MHSAAWHGGSAGGSGTRRGIEGARDLARDGQPLPLLVGMGRQGGGKQGRRIRVQGMGAQFEAVGQFDDLAGVHDGNTGADVRHGSQVMTDEEITHP